MSELGPLLHNRGLSYVLVNIFHDVISHRLHHSLSAFLLGLNERYFGALAALCHRSRFHFRLVRVFAGNHGFLERRNWQLTVHCSFFRNTLSFRGYSIWDVLLIGVFYELVALLHLLSAFIDSR